MLDSLPEFNKLAQMKSDGREVAMRRPLLFIAAIIAVLFVALIIVSPGQAADLNVNSRHTARPDADCGPYGCPRYRITTSCPDRLSCYPLYGAYGPYGGVGYWSAYSYR